MKKVLKIKLRIICLFSALFLSVFTAFLLPKFVYGKSNNDGISYEVKPLLESDQKDQSIDYFYYQVKPNEQKKIAIEIKNHADKPQTFAVEFNRAKTNGNGMIDYSLKQKLKDRHEKKYIDIHQLVDNPNQKIVVEANKSKIVNFNLRLPNINYEGILLGGIYVVKINENNYKTEKKSEGIELQQTLAYAIAVMLQEKVPYQGGNQLIVDSISADVKDNQSILKIKMENPKPNILNKVKIKMEIYKAGEDKIYSEIEKENMSFAPEDLFSLEIPWSKDKIKNGRYNVNIIFTSGENKWKFKKEFAVTREEIKKIEKEIISQDTKHVNKYAHLFIAALVTIIILLSLLLFKKRKG